MPDAGVRQKSILGVNALKVEFPIGNGRRRRMLHAIDGVDLDLFEGEALGLVGESGCGKSTLAKVVVGLQMPTSGSVLVGDREIPDKRDRAMQRRVQLVFQDPSLSLNPRLTVGQVLRELLSVHKMVPRSAVAERTAELISLVGLPPHSVDAYPRRLSGGQRQRVAIARALALEPDVLVADEPVAALDVSVQATILNLLNRLRSELGLSMLFISHDLAVVRRVCDRVAVMYLGRVVEVGPADQIFGSPRHPYTRALIDSVPGVHERRAGTLRQLEGDPPSPVDLPSGCRFRPRCSQAFEDCGEDPVLLPAGPNRMDLHQAACHWSARALGLAPKHPAGNVPDAMPNPEIGGS